MSPPNGGLVAWLQVLSTFCLWFNTYGISNSFGVFQTYYEENLGDSVPKASLIGSVQSFLIFFGPLLAGPLYDAGYYRYLLVIGSVAVVIGTFMQSLSNQFWQLILSQSICIGFGGGIIAFIGPSILSTYFTDKLSLASGIGQTGSSIAGIIYPILFGKLEPNIGFGWTVRIFGFISLVTLIIPVFTMQPHVVAIRSRHIWDTTIFRDFAFITFVVGNFLVILGIYTPFVYVQSFAIDSGLSNTYVASYVLSAMNLSMFLGKVIPPLITPKFGPFNMLIFSLITTGVAGLAFLPVHSLPSLIVVSLVFAFQCGAFFAFQPVVLIGLCPDPGMVGTRFGMAFAILAIGLVPSFPVAGALLDSFGYQGLWLWTGITVECGALVMIAARARKVGWAVMTKV